jgi:transcriptional regulator GlxA family with amidase domain
MEPLKLPQIRKVAILLFDQVEVLDFAGPFEVFSVASLIHDNSLFEVATFAKSKFPVLAVNGLSVNPKLSLHEALDADILIIPGGVGIRQVILDEEMVNFLLKMHGTASLIFSVCSGAMLLAKAGLLAGKSYCTHHLVYPEMEKMVKDGFPQKHLRFTTSEKIVTAAGISAGIDASLHIVKSLCGESVSRATAKYMEYGLWED